MRKIIVRLVLLALIGLAALLLLWPQQVWTFVAGPADLGAVDFATLEKPGKPNAYLACPKTTCTAYTPDMEPPVFEIDAGLLRKLAIAVWSEVPDVEVVHDASADLAIRFVQRTEFLKFPDTISVKFVPVSEKQSTLAIYSRSQIGYSDLGANESRVKHWLDLLDKARP